MSLVCFETESSLGTEDWECIKRCLSQGKVSFPPDRNTDKAEVLASYTRMIKQCLVTRMQHGFTQTELGYGQEQFTCIN